MSSPGRGIYEGGGLIFAAHSNICFWYLKNILLIFKYIYWANLSFFNPSQERRGRGRLSVIVQALYKKY